mmetsp:Transcript_55101/g.102026  ORF Transcript_55101/g.102026 Transcript_55101/m.102026 type:complete len:127 (-) Transcript_55101:29-409(-)
MGASSARSASSSQGPDAAKGMTADATGGNSSSSQGSYVNGVDSAGNSYEEVIAYCKPYMDRHEKCMDVWYHRGFLQGNMQNKCEDHLEDHRACMLEQFHVRGMKPMIGYDTLGPPPLSGRSDLPRK